MSGIVVFKRPGYYTKASTVDPTVAVLEDLIKRLKLPILNPYHARGMYAAEDLKVICDRLKSTGKVTVGDVEKLVHVRDWIKWDLDRGITS